MIFQTYASIYERERVKAPSKKYLGLRSIFILSVFVVGGFLFLGFAKPVFAGNACSTTKAGNWDDASVWTGCGSTYPGSGDTITIWNAVHVNVNTTVGNQGAGSGNIDIRNNGNIIVDAGVTFHILGGIQGWTGGTLTLSAGSTLNIDTETSGSSRAVGGLAGFTVVASGTAGSHVTITGSGTVNPRFTVTAGSARSFIYTDFTNLGTASGIAAVTVNGGTVAVDQIFDHVTFTNCGYLDLTASTVTTTRNEVTNTVFSGSLYTRSIDFKSTVSSTGSGTRLIDYVVLDGLLYSTGHNLTGLTINHSYLGDGISSQFTDTRWALLANSFLISTADNGISLVGDVTDSYELFSTATDNPHYMNIYGPAGTYTIDGLIGEAPFFTNSLDIGDYVLVRVDNAKTVNITRTIQIPVNPGNSASQLNLSPGVLLTLFTTATDKIVNVYHNTLYGGISRGFANGVIVVGEGSGSITAGAVATLQDNIFWDTVDEGSERSYATATQADGDNGLTPAGVTNNSFWRFKTDANQPGKTSNNTAYNVPTTGTVPGANDLANTNPNFVDPTVRFELWAVSRGSVSVTAADRIADGLTYLKADPSLVASSLIPYIRNGFKVRNATLLNAGHDGVTIGAESYVSSAATVTSAQYTVSALSSGAGTITNVPYGTAKADFLAALTLATGASWNATSVADPVVSGNTLVVTAQDGTTQATYTVTVNASTDATLSNLIISSGTLTPTFSSGTISYTDSVANSVTSLTVTPTKNQANATITVNGVAVTSGSPSGSISLNIGSNTITIVVTAQDGITTSTYTITVTRVPIVPTLTTSAPTLVASSTMTLNANISATGGADATQHGFAYGTVANLSTVIATTTGGAFSGIGDFTSTSARNISGLTPNTLYYFRAYAVNSAGTSTDLILSTTTIAVVVPTLTTQSASSLAQTSAVLNGNITDIGQINSTEQGFAYSTTSLPYTATSTSLGSFGTGTFSASLSDLICNTTYHFRSYANNTAGYGYGEDVTFTTSACDVATTPTPTSSNSFGGSAQSRISNLIAMGFYTQAQEVAKQYNLSIPKTIAPQANSIQSIGTSFTRTLRYGMTGNDVKALQVFLNSKGFIVSPTGAGSPGKETTYFGPATKSALIKFQDAYAEFILKPQGLTRGTGLFGEGTRGFVRERF